MFERLRAYLIFAVLFAFVVFHVNYADDTPWHREEYFDFAQEYRLDYIPYFEDNNAPTDSSEYLMWAYTMDFPWSITDKSMSTSYIEDMVDEYFKVAALEHHSLPECWEYKGDTYASLLTKVNPLPIVILRSYEELERDGKTVYQIELDFCDTKIYGTYPTQKQIKKIKKQIFFRVSLGLKVSHSDRYSFYLEDGKPVFTSHISIPQ